MTWGGWVVILVRTILGRLVNSLLHHWLYFNSLNPSREDWWVEWILCLQVLYRYNFLLPRRGPEALSWIIPIHYWKDLGWDFKKEQVTKAHKGNTGSDNWWGSTRLEETTVRNWVRKIKRRVNFQPTRSRNFLNNRRRTHWVTYIFNQKLKFSKHRPLNFIS